MHSRDLIEQYKGYVQEWRRYFHKHPELSNEEFETTKTLAKELESMGVEVHVDTERGIGLIGIIHGDKPGKAIALRADIDALPVHEHNTVDYKSETEGTNITRHYGLQVHDDSTSYYNGINRLMWLCTMALFAFTLIVI